MRIVFLAPWFRTLANIWAQELQGLGHEVLVVTKSDHFERLTPQPGEIIVARRPRSVAGLAEYPRLRRVVRAFGADVVVAEELRDPRLPLIAASGTPHVLMVHDAVPHDETHAVPWQRRVSMSVLDRRVVAVVAFSQVVAHLIEERSGAVPVKVIPLPSEMSDNQIPPFVPAESRRDFFCIGRIRPYKNLATVASAWEVHVRSNAYRGDVLRIIGEGELGLELPALTDWTPGPFSFGSVAPQLAAGKGSVALYRAGSQSGVQIFSMQVGCPPIVSSVGGFAEYQVPDLPPLDPTDIAGLADQFGLLSDPLRAAAMGQATQDVYRERFSALASARMLAEALEGVLGR